MKADYTAANMTRHRSMPSGVNSLGSGADYHYRNDAAFYRLIEIARALDRNDMVIGQAVTRVVDSVLQNGVRLDAKTGDSDLDRYITAKWNRWANDPKLCHSERMHTITQLARLCFRSRIVDGDCFVLPLETGEIETVEAHRCKTPTGTKRNVVLGVLMDQFRKRLEYWFSKEDINPTSSISLVGDIKPYPAYDKDGYPGVFHLYDPKRLSQTRGVTAFAPIVDVARLHDDLEFANLVKAQSAACIALLRERPAKDSVMGPAHGLGEEIETIIEGGEAREIEWTSPGMDFAGAPGETLKGFAPNIPNPEFFEHASLVLRIIGANLGIPDIVMMLDATKTNFSAYRGALEQARIGYAAQQELMVQQFYRPIYEWKLRQWIISDPVIRAASTSNDLDVFDHAWNPPEWDYIDPVKDASADRLIISGLLNSRRGVLAKRGLDIEEIDREIVADGKRILSSAMEAAQELAAEYPESGVTWRDILNHSRIKSPSGVNSVRRLSYDTDGIGEGND